MSIKTSESTKFLVQALADFHRSEVSVPKTSTNPFFHSKYADLWTIKFICEPHLNALGLVVTQFPGTTEQGQPTLITRLCHTSGEYMEAEVVMALPKDDPQGFGSATTYYRRYAYTSILGVVADPDDDANAASVPRVKKVMDKTKPAVLLHEEFEPLDLAPGTAPIPKVPAMATVRTEPERDPDAATDKQVKYLRGLLREQGFSAGDVAALCNTECPPWPGMVDNLTKYQANKMIDLVKP